MNHEELEVIQSMTGCKKPCNYLEYKFHGGSLPSSFNSGFPFVSLVSRTRFTTVEREELLYPSSTMVAEVGGVLGLFLGVSFMTVWDGLIWVRENFGYLKSWASRSFKRRNTQRCQMKEEEHITTLSGAPLIS